MMRAIFILAICFVAMNGPARAQHHVHSASDEDPHIVVTINPEARISVARHAALPEPRACGEALELSVKIVNAGAVTAPVAARLIGDGAAHVSLLMDAEALSGADEETRVLHLFPNSAQPTDVTIAFGIRDEVGDLGGRDRIHLLVRCGVSP